MRVATPSLLRGALFVLVVASVQACSGTDSEGDASGGASFGGASFGGTSSSLGGTQSSGGAVGSGGALPTSGGASSGGASSTGGVTAAGGAPQGGLGGATLNGGAPAQGGSNGGTSGAAPIGGATSGGASAGGGSANAGATSSGGKAASGGASSGGASSGGASALCPPGITQTITVAKTGGQFTTVQAAVNSIPSGSSARIRIDIRAGKYVEKLTIASRTNLCLVGESATTTILSYGDNNAAVGSTSGSASVHVSANDFSAANLTIENSFGSGSQAVALRTTGQRQQFLNCRFVGYQDTLYTHNGVQYFKNCYVQGNTDYVFGGATAVLQNCEVRNVEGGTAVSAPSTDAANAFGIVFLGGSFTAASSIKVQSVALGRPWGAQGAAAYLNVALGAHILPAGFVVMGENPPQNARFEEYKSTGTGAAASSRSAYQMTDAEAARYTLGNIFGSWVPSYSTQ